MSIFKHISLTAILALLLLHIFVTRSPAQRAAIESRVQDPYLSAIVIDADSGMILFADNPDAPAYPASVLKTMVLLLALEKVAAGELKLSDQVLITAEAAQMGGTQVYLTENETFTVDDLLYALMIQSANDAAMALALHIAGSRDRFVALMNQRAQSLGMKSTVFHSPHGLPPTVGQQPDVTTARDLAKLARAILQHQRSTHYSSTKTRAFRESPLFVMHNHNKLLDIYTGCDGLKTGYYRLAGYAIIATAQRDARRIVAVILGCPNKALRDHKAMELLDIGFAKLPPSPAAALPSPPLTTPQPDEDAAGVCDKNTCPPCYASWVVLAGLIILTTAMLFKLRKRAK